MIRVETDARGVATLSLSRADKHNALSAELIGALHGEANRLARDNAVRVVVLAADGPTFCAGGDLGWMRAQMTTDAATRRDSANQLASMLGALNALPKPLIGRIHGNAFGGGVGMACICDVAIGVAGTKFGLTETKLGLIPATIGPYVLARMGEAAARQVFMSSQLFDAQRACDLNILSRVVDADALDAAIEAEVAPYLNCAPGAVAAAKALALRGGISDEQVANSIDALIAQWEGDEAPEGIAAFFEKRKPRWAMPAG